MRAPCGRSLLAALSMVVVACGAAKTPGGSSTVCAASPITASSSVASGAPAPVPTNGVPPPAVVCERLRKMLAGTGAKEQEIGEFVADCLNELSDTRQDDPQTYACEARCFMIVPGVDADVGCEELCAADTADDCKEWRAEDGTVSDAATAACRDRVARIRATTDDKTMLCALGCAAMGGPMRAMDECFSRCL